MEYAMGVMVRQQCHTWGLVLLVMVILLSSSSPLSSSSSSSSFFVRGEQPCNGTGCCDENNFAPGPLNLSASAKGFDSTQEDQKVFIYHCVRYFTSFNWYLRARDGSGKLELYPWGQAERVSYIANRQDNQTVVISPLEREDRGTYVYVASNDTHTVMGEFELEVNCRKRDPSFANEEQPKQSVDLAASKTLHCALNPPDCAGVFYEDDVFWTWRWLDSNHTHLLKNTTLDSVDVVCNTRPYYGSSCEVLIHNVHEDLYKGEFICRAAGYDNLRQSVRLVAVKIEVKTWLPWVVGVAVAVVVVAVLVVTIKWRYGHRLAFRCRSLPDRGDFEEDAAILHGEDHQTLVKETLKPHFEELGYRILEEMANQGRPELAENLNAAERCHSAILTFSARELAEEGQIQFLNNYVFRRKTHKTVVFIRRPDDDDDDAEARRDANDARLETAGDDDGREALRRNVRNVWKDEALKAFKIVTMPRALERSQKLSWKESRDVEKFWYTLRNHLPKPLRQSSLTRGQDERATRSRTESHRLLMGRQSMETSSSAVSSRAMSSQCPMEATAEAEDVRVEKTSLLYPPHSTPLPAPDLNGKGSNPWLSPITAPDHDDDDVFENDFNRTRPSNRQQTLQVTSEYNRYASPEDDDTEQQGGTSPQPSPPDLGPVGVRLPMDGDEDAGELVKGSDRHHVVSSEIYERQESGYNSPISQPEAPFVG